MELTNPAASNAEAVSLSQFKPSPHKIMALGIAALEVDVTDPPSTSG
jgi:hypothetical protein